MKLMKLLSFFIFTVFSFNTYADENKHIFMGQNGNGELAKTVFFLEVSAEDMNSVFVMGENGEIYLKADKVVAIPKAALANFASTVNFRNPELAEGISEIPERDSETWRCSNCNAMNADWRTKCRVCDFRKP